MKIVRFPHPALRHAVPPLTAIDEKVRTHARQMLDLMYEFHGVGLATNQVFLPYQMFVMNETADPTQREHENVFINPIIAERKGTIEGDEGCLSFPDLFQKVRRSRTVVVKAYNLQGEAITITKSDLPSRVLQHEIDHLKGELFIDKMGPIAKIAARSRLKELERDFHQAQERGEIPSDLELKRLLDDLQRSA